MAAGRSRVTWKYDSFFCRLTDIRCLLRILCIHHNIDVKIEEAYYLLSHWHLVFTVLAGVDVDCRMSPGWCVFTDCSHASSYDFKEECYMLCKYISHMNIKYVWTATFLVEPHLLHISPVCRISFYHKCQKILYY